MKPRARKLQAHQRRRARHEAARREKRRAYRPRTVSKERRIRRPKVLRGPLSVLDWRSANVGRRMERSRQKVVNE